MNDTIQNSTEAPSSYSPKYLDRLLILSILFYVTFHLIEEATLGFPAWAELRWGIPGYNLPMWLEHNFFFLSCLLITYLIYAWDRENRQFVGYGIILWGVLNFLNHLIFSLIFWEISPGLFTGSIFLVFGILSMKNDYFLHPFAKKKWGSVIIIGILNWVIPIGAFLFTDIIILG